MFGLCCPITACDAERPPSYQFRHSGSRFGLREPDVMRIYRAADFALKPGHEEYGLRQELLKICRLEAA